MVRKQDPKKKKLRLKQQEVQEPEVRLKVRKPQPKDNKYKNNKKYWLEEEA